MKKIFLTLLATASIMAAGWFAFATGFTQKTQESDLLNDATFTLVNTNESIADMDEDEKKILKELQELFAGVNDSGSSFIMQGIIDIADPADTLQLENKTPFTFYKEGSIIFYEITDQQMVNTPTYYAVADRELKRIIVAPSKTIEAAQPISLSALGKNFKGEGYTIKKQLNGHQASIQLLCENHISCKEVKVTYDTTTQKPLYLFYRYTDLDHPEDKKYDKTVTIHIKEWQLGRDQIKNQSIPHIIHIDQDSIIAADGLEAYEIIDLYHK